MLLLISSRVLYLDKPGNSDKGKGKKVESSSSSSDNGGDTDNSDIDLNFEIQSRSTIEAHSDRLPELLLVMKRNIRSVATNHKREMSHFMQEMNTGRNTTHLDKKEYDTMTKRSLEEHFDRFRESFNNATDVRNDIIGNMSSEAVKNNNTALLDKLKSRYPNIDTYDSNIFRGVQGYKENL